MKINWQTYASHNEKEIKGFFGDYRFLSNFHECEVCFESEFYRSTEAAYMAAKTLNKDLRQEFRELQPKEARRLGREIKLRPRWDALRLDVMFAVNFDKYNRHTDLREKLLATGNAYLEETNAWHDQFWGVSFDTNQGENNLGKILMRVRALFQ